MMMCIGGVSDFEAQLTASVERFTVGSAEDVERRVRGGHYCYARFYMDKLHPDYWIEPLEPQRLYSHGRRFIPAWLHSWEEPGEEPTGREHSMARDLFGDGDLYHHMFGHVHFDDPTIARRSA